VIALVARARGLGTRVLDEALVAEGPAAIERAVRTRLAQDLAILVRWSGHRRDDVGTLELDEDRHSCRAMVRGLAGGIAADRRRDGCVPTSRLPARVLAQLAEAGHIDELAAILRELAHPFAPAFVAGDEGTIDLLAIETRLTRLFAEHALAHAFDDALRAYVANIIDTENAVAAIELASRGGDLAPADAFVRGGTRLTDVSFARAAASPPDVARELLADAFAGTPLARSFVAPAASAIDDALLAWQLATQRARRRLEPHGFAAVIYLILKSRDEARRLRRAAWRRALGGAA
jgi:vacuolar-type H+-ATPase subunit C/Vma6